MTIQPKQGHYYERRDGEIIQYDHPNEGPDDKTYPHIINGQTYTDDGAWLKGGVFDMWDLLKDLGPPDPHLKEPRKKPVQKFRKVRMWFLEYNSPDYGKVLYNYNMKCTAIAERVARGPRCGPIFSQIINVPVQARPTKETS